MYHKELNSHVEQKLSFIGVYIECTIHGTS